MANDYEEAGKCPECRGNDLQYGSMEPEDGQCYYPWTCNSCGAVGKEWYSMEFIEHTTDEDE